MNRGGPCRVAAEASSAALPSCCQLPAAWTPAGISGCGRAGPASGAPLLCLGQARPAGPSSAGAALTAQSSASTAFRVSWVQIPFFMVSDQLNGDRDKVTSVRVPCHLQCCHHDILTIRGLPPLAPTNRRLALAASSSIAGIFFIELVSTGIVGGGSRSW